MKITGVGMRTRVVFNVYALGHYLQEGSPVTTVDELCKSDVARMLYLVMERNVDGSDVIDSFKTAINKYYPKDKFAAEFAQFSAAVGSQSLVKGDHVSITYTPGTGTRVICQNKFDVTIKNAAFAQAVWEIFLGSKPVDADLKKGLVSLLGK
jgi:hypothetical protein